MSRISVKPTIKDVPNDCLLYLFSTYLDFDCKLEAEKVCKQWHEIIGLSFECKRTLIIVDYELHESRIKSLNLSNRKISIVKMVSYKLIERTEKKDKLFISLILRKYRNLETLCVCLKYTKCNNKFLDLVSKYGCESLQNLRIELSDCSVNNKTLIVSQEEVLQISEKMPKLKHFYIDFVILFIHESSLQTIFTKWSNIESIVFHLPCFRGSIYNSELEHTMSTEFSGDHFASVSKSVVRLGLPGNVLNLNAINRIPGNTNLKRLRVFKLNVNSIELICQKFSSLIHFGFSVENNINEEDMYYLMECVGKLHKLEELYLAIISGIPINYNCIKFLRSCKRLNSLQIDQTLLSKEAIDAIARYFPYIQNLELWTSGLNQNFHHCLTDSVIINIKRLKYLRKLNFRGQRNLTDSAIATLVSNCHLLETIDVRTTKVAIITLKVCIERSKHSTKTIEVFIHETPISRLFGNDLKRFEICEHLLLSNEDYDYKIYL